MCGIAGYSTIGTNSTINPDLIRPMLYELQHRGPDENGFITESQIAMGNTRLSIIDIENGRQPISNEDGSITVVFNGEIYNSPELRTSLKALGHRFKTLTDTEVLVHLYEEYSLKFLEMLNGMFTLSLYDRNKNSLIVARDRFGVKPLFWKYSNNQLFFASEIKSLKKVISDKLEIDPQGLSVFLGLFYIPDPWTVYKDIRRLNPGHYLHLTSSGLSYKKYFQLDYTRKKNITFNEASEETAFLLRRSVKRQMLADVPVGVLLSSGVDSRCILSAACELNENINSFTLGFNEKLYNENNIASQWAHLNGSRHNVLIFTQDMFCANYLDRQSHLDEPYALWCNVAMGELAKFIYKNNFKVVLSGEGGDENFLGYPTVHAANIYRYYSKLPGWLRNNIIANFINRLPAGKARLPLTFKLKSFVNADHPNFYRTFFGFKEVIKYKDWKQYLTPAAYNLIGGIDPFLCFNQHIDDVRDLHFIDALSYLDFKIFLPGSSFFGNDNAFMSSSIETRVPFMDNDLVNFCCQLPTSVKFNPTNPKVILKDVLKKNFTPPSYKLNTKKLGFEIPGNIWLKNSMFQNFLSSILSESKIKQSNFFKWNVVEKLINDHLQMKQNNERILQAIMSLVLFLDNNKIRL